MKTIIYKALLPGLLLILPTIIAAQTKEREPASNSTKLDSVYVLQKKIYDEVKYDPLANKKFGIELNLIRLLTNENRFSLSGGFSLFDVCRYAEIAFPFYLQTKKESTDLASFTLDCHYRYFLGRYQKGFYLSAFLRYAILNGTVSDTQAQSDPINPTYTPTTDTENKIGLGFGLGYRIFSVHGLYWGTSLNIGRYVIGKNNKFSGNFLEIDNDNEVIVDVELLKFGWAF